MTPPITNMLAKLHPARKEAWLWAFVVFASVLAAIGIALLAPRMAPIQEGDAATFWRYAAGVQLVNDAADDRGGYAYFIDDAWCAYESPHWHGSKLHRVPRKAVTEQLSVVVSKLEWKIQSGDEDAVTRGYRRWREQSEPEQTDATLHQAIEGERWRDLAAADIDGVINRATIAANFWQRWQRVDWYWANIVFEWIFLTGLALFLLYPFIRRQSFRRWGLHLAFFPTCFLLPVHLGYAVHSFTSAGPSGGILYPYLVGIFRSSSFTKIDDWLLARMPQILEPLSTDIGTPVAITGLGMPGPFTTLLYGLTTATIVMAIKALMDRGRGSPTSAHRSA